MEGGSAMAEGEPAAVKKETGLPYTRHVNRRLAWQLTQRLQWATPNQVTAVAFAILLLALGVILARDDLLGYVLAYLLLAVNYILDSVDGQLARVRSMQSPLGEWLDHSLDGLRLLLLNAVLASQVLFFVWEEPQWALLGGAAIALNLVFQPGNFFVGILKDKVLGQRTGEILSKQTGSWKRRMVLISVTPLDYGIVIMTVLLLADMTLFIPIYFLYGILFFIVVIANYIITVRQKIGPDAIN
jgi:phosphatidylglycerophosphate synthase